VTVEVEVDRRKKIDPLGWLHVTMRGWETKD